METEQMQRLNAGEPVAISLADLVAWRRRSSGSRLLLPPIQRSLVWTNKQIIEYWDSLLRGYPPGLMLVHRTRAMGTAVEDHAGIDQCGKLVDAGKDDYHLFDGQQRMAAILLGLGEGPLASSLRLWVDLGADLDASPLRESGLRHQLRISSWGQPFGYKPEAPNEKIEVSRRREQWDKFIKDRPQCTDPFHCATGADLIDAKHAVQFKDLWREVPQLHGSVADDVNRTSFLVALKAALSGRIIVQLLSGPVIDEPEEYTRFFGRYGQGGTRLSNEELTYSIIKNLFPVVRERIETITSASGRLASEVDLVLATMRVAKVLEKPWPIATKWQITARPDPSFAATLRSNPDMDALKKRFHQLIVEQNGLERVMQNLRSILEYNAPTNPDGLPRILLARLPRELIDVLLLLVFMQDSDRPLAEEDPAALIAFALHWLLFISNGEKAANLAFMKVTECTLDWGRESIALLWRDFEAEGIAYTLPNFMQVQGFKKDLEQQSTSAVLRAWPERFKDRDGDASGAFLRVLSTNNELTKRILLWLQRKEITEQFPNFDPTSGRDEDLPIDLDHIIPHATFGGDWRLLQDNIELNPMEKEIFRRQRGTVGNSLGNFRWLAASVNRSRGMNKDAELDPEESERDLVEDSGKWNELIPKRDGPAQRKWSESDVAAFQYLIDRRTLLLYEKFLCESGIEALSKLKVRTAQ